MIMQHQNCSSLCRTERIIEATQEDRISPLKSQMGDSLHGHADLSLFYLSQVNY